MLMKSDAREMLPVLMTSLLARTEKSALTRHSLSAIVSYSPSYFVVSRIKWMVDAL